MPTAKPRGPAKTKGRAPRAKSGDKRNRILDAAVRVFAKNGFYKTRVADIARAAGVADGTIYLYFASKEDLLVSLFEDRVQRVVVFMEGLSHGHSSPRDRLRAVIAMQLGQLQEERDLAEVITVIVRQSTHLLRRSAVPHFAAYIDALAHIVRDGQKSGEFRSDLSAGTVARIIFGALDGLTLTWALGRAEPGALARAAEQLTTMLMAGLAP